MQKLALFILLSLSFLYSRAQDSVSVLFIGNSYTYVNNLPLMLSELTESKGDKIFYSSQTIGGATFAYHASNSATYTAINSNPWDYVVLQAQSQEPSFPDSQVDTETLPYAKQMADSIYKNKFCSEVLYFLTWGRKNGDSQWQPIATYDGMQARLRNAYLRFADSTQGSVSPVGAVWKYVRENYPSIELYSADESHPSVHGTYLAACTFYASLFRKTPVGASFYSTLSQADAEVLQQAVATTLMDSLDVWNLRSLDEHTEANFDFLINGNTVDLSNSSSKAIDFEWSFGDGFSDFSESPTHTYLNEGTYTIQLIAISSCDRDTITHEINLGTTASTTKIKWNPTIYSDKQFIQVKSERILCGIELRCIDGGSCEKLEPYTKSINIDRSRLNKGVYIIGLSSDSQTIYRKIYIP